MAEVGWDGDNGRVDSVSEVVGGGLSEALEQAGGGLLNGNGGWLALLLVLDGESNGVVDLLWVCGGVGVGWVYRLEPSDMLEQTNTSYKSFLTLVQCNL